VVGADAEIAEFLIAREAVLQALEYCVDPPTEPTIGLGQLLELLLEKLILVVEDNGALSG